MVILAFSGFPNFNIINLYIFLFIKAALGHKKFLKLKLEWYVWFLYIIFRRIFGSVSLVKFRIKYVIII